MSAPKVVAITGEGPVVCEDGSTWEYTSRGEWRRIVPPIPHGEEGELAPAVGTEVVAWRLEDEDGDPCTIPFESREEAEKYLEDGYHVVELVRRQPLGVIGPVEERAGTAPRHELEAWLDERERAETAGEADGESVRCSCEWASPMTGEVEVWPAALDPTCPVHSREDVRAMLPPLPTPALATREPGAPTVEAQYRKAHLEVLADRDAAHAALTAAGVPLGTLVERIGHLRSWMEAERKEAEVWRDTARWAQDELAARWVAQRGPEGERLEGWVPNWHLPGPVPRHFEFHSALPTEPVDDCRWTPAVLIIVPPEGRAEGGENEPVTRNDYVAPPASAQAGAGEALDRAWATLSMAAEIHAGMIERNFSELTEPERSEEADALRWAVVTVGRALHRPKLDAPTSGAPVPEEGP